MSNARELSQIATAIVVDTSKNVSVAEKITVTKDSSISGLTVGKGGGAVASNTATGLSALGTNTSGVQNTASGNNALGANTDGAGNAAFGSDALRLATASDNTGIGARALYSNTTGSQNTAVGRLALNSNTTASNNTAVGYQAGYTTTVGNTTSVGYRAGYLSTTGGSWVAVGNESLYSNTTGSENTSIGSAALFANTTGSSNVAVGRTALFSNTTASYNTAVGYQAGYTGTTGDANTFLGFQAGYSKTTSASNTFVGAGAGYTVTTGAGNTIIGRYNGNTGGLDIRTASNHIVLSDGDGNPRCYWDGSGNMLFNTTTIYGSAKFNLSFVGNANSGIMINDSTNTNGATMQVFYKTGTLIGSITNNNNTGVAYNTTSDYRLKENVEPITGALAKVAQLKPCTYKWKVDGSDGEGFIAHELAEVVPHAVTGEKDAVDTNGNIKPQAIDTSFLVATLTAAIQELNAKLEAQALEIAQLKGN